MSDPDMLIILLLFCAFSFLAGAALGAKYVEQQIHKTIELCEVELPRNRTCELVAFKKDLSND